MASSKKLQPVELPGHLAHFLVTCVRPGQTLLLGLSGGLDSCVLLHLLAGLRSKHDFELRALHVNHGISPNAGDWETFCAELCAARQVAYSAVRVSVPRDSGLGLEAAAREARYQVLLRQPVDAVVLAHHEDDQAETLLLQLLRGAGAKGLAAMPASSDRRPGQPQLLRPLLNVPRRALAAYARLHHLSWIEDESNLDLAYDRNFLRLHIFPELEKRFPACRPSLSRSSAHLAETAALLDELAQQDAELYKREGRLDIAGLRVMSPARAKNLLRYWLAGYESVVSARRLEEILRQLLQARDNAEVCVEVPAGTVHRYRGQACFSPRVDSGQPARLRWQGESELPYAGGRLVFMRELGKGIALAAIRKHGLEIRCRAGGERMRLHPNGPHRSLKNLFQEHAIPSWQRPHLPLLFVGDALAMVPGVGIGGDYLALPEEEGLAVIWQVRLE